MKNWIGLLIALSLGIVACLLNWQYLEQKSKEIEFVSFLALGDNVRLKPGESFLEEHFVRLDIPRKNVGALPETAVLFEDRNAVVKMKAIQEYRGGEVVLRQQLKTPAKEFTLKKHELALWIPVNASTFVPSLVKSGDLVSFVVTDPNQVFDEILRRESEKDPIGPEFLTSASEADSFSDHADASHVDSELVGPFRVLSLGDRLGSYKVDVATNGSRSRENVMGVAIQKIGDGVDPKAEKLIRWMAQPNFREAAVVLHPRVAAK